MPAKRATSSSPSFWINPRDSQGRAIAPRVLSAATEIGQRAIAYGERMVGDSALAQNLFEEAAATVSEALGDENRQIANISAYLFRSYVRLLAKHIRNLRTEDAPSDDLDCLPAPETPSPEHALLIDQLLAGCDTLTRGITFRHLEGFSWQEIGFEFGIPAHTAELRFQRFLDRARKTYGKRGRKV